MPDTLLINYTPLTRNDFLKDVIQQFIKRRHDLGYSQDHVDALMGNSDRLVSKWECSMRIPTTFNAYCWAEALHCELYLKQR